MSEKEGKIVMERLPHCGCVTVVARLPALACLFVVPCKGLSRSVCIPFVRLVRIDGRLGAMPHLCVKGGRSVTHSHQVLLKVEDVRKEDKEKKEKEDVPGRTAQGLCSLEAEAQGLGALLPSWRPGLSS